MKINDDKKKVVTIVGLIAFGVALFALLMNFGPVLGALKTLIGFFLPLIAGVVIAFILDVPVRGFQKLLGRIWPKAKSSKLRTPAVVLTLLVFAGVIALIAVTVNPVVADSARSAYTALVERIPSLSAMIGPGGALASAGDYLKKFLTEGLPQDLTDGLQQAAFTLAGKAADTVSFLATFGIGIIVAIYVLLDKERVLRHMDKLITAVFPQRAGDSIRRVCRMLNDSYSRFLSGQCIEALILSVFMFIVLTIFRIPYAALISVLAAVFSFVPYLGSFLALFIGALLIFITARTKLILYLILYLAVQVIEEQVFYPHVVGNSVGLTPLLTLLSVIIGGSTFGLLGVLFFIPLMSVGYELVREWANRRIEMKEKQTDLQNGGTENDTGMQ